MVGTDGQPQGPHPPVHILPCPYYTRPWRADSSYRRGERGEDAGWWALVVARPLGYGSGQQFGVEPETKRAERQTMNDTSPVEVLPISSLNALEYCPRKFYYQFVQGEMLVNEYVLEGTLAHQRVHQEGTHTTAEGGMQTTRLYCT